MNRERIGTYSAYAALIVFLVGELLFRYSTLNFSYSVFYSFKFVDVFDCAAMGLAVIAIISRPRKMSTWQVVLAGAGVAVFYLSARWTTDYRVLYGFVLLVAIADKDIKTICGIYGYTMLLIVALIMILSSLGIVYNKDVIPNSRLVFTYGFLHPNITGSLFMAGLLPLAYYHWDSRMWWVPCILALAGGTFAYVLLSSHASSALLVLMGVLFAIGHIPHLRRFWPIPKKAFFLVLVCVPLLIMTVMWFLMVFYNGDNSFFTWANKILHGRPVHAHNYFVEHGFSIFGTKSAAISSYHTGIAFNNVDCGYCQLAMMIGLLPLCILVATYIAAIRRYSVENRHFIIFVAFLLASLHMVIEYHQFYLGMGFAIPFMSVAFAGSKDEAPQQCSETLIREKTCTHLEKMAPLAVAVLLLAAFASSAFYANQHTKVDIEVAVGEMTIGRADGIWATFDIEEDMTANIEFANHDFEGRLVFAGAEEDTILFQLKDIEMTDKPEAKDAVLLLRMPRTGLQGDYSGVWVLYYWCSSLDERRSLWIIANENGTAGSATKYNYNALIVPRFRIVELSNEWLWQKDGTHMEMTPTSG